MEEFARILTLWVLMPLGIATGVAFIALAIWSSTIEWRGR